MTDPVRVSLVIPAKDEGARIAAAVREAVAAVAEVDPGGEVIVVDDGSTDDTADQAERAGAAVVRLPSNRGKGAAVRAGVLAASGEVIAYTDADLSYAPAVHLPRLVAAIDGGCAVAVGSRRHRGSEALVHPDLVRRVSSRAFNIAVAALVLRQVRDTQCGVKAFRRDVGRAMFSQARIDGFAFDVELFAIARALGVEVCDVPVRLVSDDVSTVKVVPAATRMIRDLLEIRRLARAGAYRPADDAEGAPGDR